MAVGSTLDSVAFIYRRDYSTHQIAELALRDHVWYTKLAKEGGFGGEDGFTYPVRYGNPQGVSGTFARARANVSGSKGLQFRAQRCMKYGIITLDDIAIRASKGSGKAFYNLVTMETDRIIEELGDSLAFDFHRDTSGLRGRIASITGNVIALEDPDDARNFKEDLVLIADNAANGLTPRVGSTFVTAVDEDNNEIALDDVSDITGLQVGDYLFRDGDPGTCIEGLEVCTPLDAPVLGVDDFRGKDRGVNPKRLAGVRIDNPELNPEVIIAKLAVACSKIGKSHMPDEAYVSPDRHFEMTQRMNAKVEYTDAGGTGNYGFQYIVVHTTAGPVRVFADPDARPDRVRTTKDGTQYIKHLDGLPHIIDTDGNMSLRMTDENAIETRAQAISNLIQDDPAAQGVGSCATS
jgi:hypothetical protein